MDFNNIKKIIQGFVSMKIAEDVSVDLSDERIEVEHTHTNGSTVLAILWVKVFQHPENFPVSAYSYRRHKNTDGSESLVVHIDDAQISVNLLTGKLTIDGHYALDWFKTRFLNVVWAFESNLEGPRELTPYPKEVPLKEKYNYYLRKDTKEGMVKHDFFQCYQPQL